MALEPIRGPTGFLLEGSPVGLSDRPRWHDELGMCGFSWDGVGSAHLYSIAQLDGAVHIRNNNPSAFLAMPLGLDLQSEYLLWMDTSGFSALYTFDPVTGNIAESVGSGSDFYMSNDGFARLTDRFIQTTGGVVRARPLTGGSAAFEYTLTGGGASKGTGHISDAGGGVVAIGFENGDCFFYDWVNQAQVGRWKSIGLANKGLWYSRRLGIWIAVHSVTSSNWTISVWNDETRPAAVSVPAALSTVQKGRVSPIRVQIIGAQGEPVSELPVDWTLPTPGGGSLSAIQSLTDDDGYAIVDFIAPANATGSMTVQAEIRF
jgi:hypothetical protein